MSLTTSTNPIPTALKRAVGAALMLSLPLTLAACATDSASRNTGERMSDRGSEIGAYGTAWSDGRESVRKAEETIEKSNRNLAKGEREIERARKDLAKAQERIADASAAKMAAEQRIADGRVQMDRAEADYAATKAGPSAVLDPGY